LAFIAYSAYEVIALAQKPNGTPLEPILECMRPLRFTIKFKPFWSVCDLYVSQYSSNLRIQSGRNPLLKTVKWLSSMWHYILANQLPRRKIVCSVLHLISIIYVTTKNY